MCSRSRFPPRRAGSQAELSTQARLCSAQKPHTRWDPARAQRTRQAPARLPPNPGLELDGVVAAAALGLERGQVREGVGVEGHERRVGLAAVGRHLVRHQLQQVLRAAGPPGFQTQGAESGSIGTLLATVAARWRLATWCPLAPAGSARRRTRARARRAGCGGARCGGPWARRARRRAHAPATRHGGPGNRGA